MSGDVYAVGGGGEFVDVGYTTTDATANLEFTDEVVATFGQPARRAVVSGTQIRRVGVRVEAAEGELFTDDDAQALISSRPRFEVTMHGVAVVPLGRGTVVDATVLDDGRAMWVVIDQTADGEVRG